jgi:hypothetical protein
MSRRLAGDGGASLRELLQMLSPGAGLRTVGSEVFSYAMRAAGSHEAGRQAVDVTEKATHRVGDQFRELQFTPNARAGAVV